MGDKKTLLSNSAITEIKKWLARFPEDKKRSAIIPALMYVQNENGGWLTESLIGEVANYLSMPKVHALEVATFYSMFELKPVGKNKICVCTNISCMLCGSGDVVKYLKEKLNIGFNEITEDGKFSLKEVECLAACGGAPAMQIGEQYYENLTPEKIDQILSALE
ncbi:MAG: NAD(P)H-dependent oxidoreductase subunit E [Francisellaceae bacterium]|jgi:NADH-quinone oxidoreductase subunit E|nr:NAD(P)H-dependent oxidoreductase subunit E [Francisellaceae bacterium]